MFPHTSKPPGKKKVHMAVSSRMTYHWRQGALTGKALGVCGDSVVPQHFILNDVQGMIQPSVCCTVPCFNNEERLHVSRPVGD